jgi:hypothetical protein
MSGSDKVREGKKIRSCGSDKLHDLFNKRKIVSNEKSIASNLIIKKSLPNNPYCSSITGQYRFDLTKISNFNVYFWKSTDDVNKNTAIKNTLASNVTTAVDWSPSYQTQVNHALNQYTTFIGKTSTVVNTYENCDIVCVFGKAFSFLGACYGPYYLYSDPIYVNNKVVFFIDSSIANAENMKPGGYHYLTLIHEFGHGFGLAHPHDTGFGSKIIPGINPYSNYNYPTIAGYLQNNILNTIMSYYDSDFFLPFTTYNESNKYGYSQTLMPLDLLAMRWLYSITGTATKYSSTYGSSTINPAINENTTKTIVGANQTITFGSNNRNVSFYFSNQAITYNNILPITYEYNRVLEKYYGFYPKDVASTISALTFSNTNVSNVFIENNGMKVNLTLNLIANKVLNMYIQDLKSNYTIVNNKYTNKKTNLYILINNNAKATINVFFNI